MRKIRMLKSDERLGFKEGDIYKVERYRFDPDKLTAIQKVPDDGVYGRDGGFNVYRESVGDEWEFVD